MNEENLELMPADIQSLIAHTVSHIEELAQDERIYAYEIKGVRHLVADTITGLLMELKKRDLLKLIPSREKEK